MAWSCIVLYRKYVPPIGWLPRKRKVIALQCDGDRVAIAKLLEL
jgi:hypothetical protein